MEAIKSGCQALMWAMFALMAFSAIAIASLIFAAVRFWPMVLVVFALFVIYRIVSPLVRGRDPERLEAETAREQRSERARIKSAIPAREPIRAAILEVIEEAYALRAMADRVVGYGFAVPGFSTTLHPETFRAKSDEAIAIALDLSERVQIILSNSRGRPRSSRAAAAMSAQRARMEQLQQALAYSRDAMEEIILTKGELPGAPDRLAQSLRTLTDAIDDSYRDPFDLEFDRTIPAITPKPAQ